MQLSERTVLITGGTRGIGLGLAKAFLAAGSQVIVCGRDETKISEVRSQFPKIHTLQCDVGDPEQRENLAKEVLKRFPTLDILVNNAGIQQYIDLQKGIDELHAGEDEITINFTSVVELTGFFIKHLLKKPNASIINVSSGLAFMPMVNTPLYSATKAALHTYTLVLRQQLAETSVQVIEVVPPMVDTNLNADGREHIPTRFRGISVDKYIPTVMKSLENDVETIFHGDGEQMVNHPRNETEIRLLNR